MGTELLRKSVKQENVEIPSIPPGFESSMPFITKKVETTGVKTSSSAISRSESQTGTEGQCSVDSKIEKPIRARPSMNNSSGDDANSEKALPLGPRLPKGVIRGCDDCANCQKVIATWHPEGACKTDLEEVPVFYPTEEEFEDTLKYIATIRPKAEAYGICRIVPPASWKPPCPLKEKQMWENSKFSTRIQRVDQLQNRESTRKILGINNQKKRKRKRCTKSGDGKSGGESRFPNDVGKYGFGFEPGPDFTMQAFQVYADDFKSQYFMKRHDGSDSGVGLSTTQGHSEPSVEDIEGEYWRVVLKPTEEIEVLYGADLETGIFGSGFPKNSNQADSGSVSKYASSGWNLNNFPRLPGSCLSYESSDISGVLVPWLYIGMCFSSFCWHVEDHHLYSLNYMHWGDPKLWYGVPASDALKMEEAMRKHLPDLFEEQPDLLHKLVTQLSPSILKNEGVPVFRCVQHAGEFVLTFPRAYHAGFNCGFNCAEAVNVAPVDWLPHGHNAVEMYREQGRKTSISHDKLLLGAARDAVKAQWELSLLKKNTSINLRWRDVCGKDGILYKAFKSRVEMEKVRRDFLCNSTQSLKMASGFDATSERECNVCLFDLHLSAAGCHNCSPKKYACLNHTNQLCPCSWSAKFFLFRYDLTELNLLVEALEGKLSAIYRWARMDLGLALASYMSKENAQTQKHSDRPSSSSEVRGMDVQPVMALKNPKENGPTEKTGVIELSDDEAGESVPEHSKKESSTGIKDAKEQDDISNPLIVSTNASSPVSVKIEDATSNEAHLLIQKDAGKSNIENGPKNLEPVTNSRPMENTQNGFRQKGPRMAKVVRRISCNVDPQEFGVVQPGKKWCDAHAIYPKGFRSRVRYISVLDPANTCYYVSEIVDVGRDGPMFMVSVEDCFSELFAHMSAVRCWEMVRERVNQEITKQHKLGKPNLPPLQPPGSLDGMEMFGFTSPAIVQVIQTMDQKRVCTEYWKSRPLMQIPQQSNGGNSTTLNPSVKSDESNDQKEDCRSHDIDITNGLLDKATREELQALSTALNDQSADRSLLLQLLNKEIRRRQE